MNKVDITFEEKCSLQMTKCKSTEKHEKHKKCAKFLISPAFYRQLFAASGAILGSIAFGSTTGFTATLLPQLELPDSPIPIDNTIESWIAGSVVLSMPLGVILNSIVMQIYGRKIAQILVGLPWIVGWLCMSFAPDIWTLLLGCLLVGFAAGLGCSVCTVYVAEISEPRYRGLISIFVSVGVTLGIFLTHCIGVLLFWRTALLLNASTVTAAFLISFYIPESPNWLVLKNKPEKAKEVFYWLRNDAKEYEHELNTLLHNRERNTQLQNRGFCRNLRSKTFLKPFSILLLMTIVQQGSGLNVIVFYAVSILSEISATKINAITYTILMDVVRVFASLCSCFFVKITGRRPLFLASVSCVLVSLISIIISIFYQLPSVFVSISFCFYVWSSFAGLAPMPWLLMGEIYPTAVKDMGSGISTVSIFIAIFVIVKTFPILIEGIGVISTFSIYTVVVFIGTVILYFYMPETNNKTLQQVEDKMKSEKLVPDVENFASKF